METEKRERSCGSKFECGIYILGSRGPIMSLESVGGRENND